MLLDRSIERSMRSDLSTAIGSAEFYSLTSIQISSDSMAFSGLINPLTSKDSSLPVSKIGVSHKDQD